MRHIIHFTFLGTLLLGLSSCINNYYEDATEYADGMVGVSLTIQTRAIANIKSSSETYVAGTEWENYIDISGGDYRIYFFAYNPTTETGSGSGENSTLIAEFVPTSIYSTDVGTYTLSGEVDKELMASLTNFKALVVANWGTYPTVTAGTTTIDDICNAQTAVFNAFVSNSEAVMPSSTLHIPFFGLREYSGVTWTAGRMTRLSGDITMLRAVAKVEVIVSEQNEEDVSFDDVSVCGYNAQGYCAPTSVYLRGDYDHDYTWGEDFVDALHLPNDANDANQDGRNFSLQQTTNADGLETWVGYLTEYDNTSSTTDYSYINVTIDGREYPIYFSNYDEDGSTTSTADYDIHRNYLYRFYVTKSDDKNDVTIRVYVLPWTRMKDEEFTL